VNFLGQDFKLNGNNVWHEGNFTPDNKANVSHTHTISTITNLQMTLDAKMNGISTGSTADPNTTTTSYILTNHANSPGNGVYWHILTFFYSSKSSNKGQIAVTYNGAVPRLMIRHIYGSTWTEWMELETTDGAQAKASKAEENAKAAIPTKLSQFQNDIGAGGIKITTSTTEPAGNSPGDFWYREV
jgi:hypothetical protein